MKWTRDGKKVETEKILFNRVNSLICIFVQKIAQTHHEKKFISF